MSFPNKNGGSSMASSSLARGPVRKIRCFTRAGVWSTWSTWNHLGGCPSTHYNIYIYIWLAVSNMMAGWPDRLYTIAFLHGKHGKHGPYEPWAWRKDVGNQWNSMVYHDLPYESCCFGAHLRRNPYRKWEIATDRSYLVLSSVFGNAWKYIDPWFKTLLAWTSELK